MVNSVVGIFFGWGGGADTMNCDISAFGFDEFLHVWGGGSWHDDIYRHLEHPPRISYRFPRVPTRSDYLVI